jgi:hypothetical protein
MFVKKDLCRKSISEKRPKIKKQIIFLLVNEYHRDNYENDKATHTKVTFGARGIDCTLTNPNNNF